MTVIIDIFYTFRVFSWIFACISNRCIDLCEGWWWFSEEEIGIWRKFSHYWFKWVSVNVCVFVLKCMNCCGPVLSFFWGFYISQTFQLFWDFDKMCIIFIFVYLALMGAVSHRCVTVFHVKYVLHKYPNLPIIFPSHKERSEGDFLIYFSHDL